MLSSVAMAAPPVAPREAPTPALVDTHTHLNDRRFAGDVDAVIERARAAGVGAMVVVGYDLASSRRAVQLAQRSPWLWAAVGIHPHEARLATPATLAEIEALASEPRVIAIGECGLDFYRNLSPPAAQRAAFEAQLALAARRGLPVIVHSRAALAETLERLAALRPPLAGVLHCFDGTLEQARQAIELGFWISCAGPLTYRRDPALAGVIARVPLERLVIETDCPWLSPAGHRGERNEPAYLPLIAQAVSRVRGVPLETVARHTTQNAAALFSTPALAAGLVEQAA
jgi:TatD DNase family protein